MSEDVSDIFEGFDNSDSELIFHFDQCYVQNILYMWTSAELESIFNFFLYIYKDLKKYKFALQVARKYYYNEDWVYYYSGKYYQAKHNYPFAIKNYTKFLYESTSNDYVLYDISYCWKKLKNYSSPIKYFKKYLKFNPFSADGWFLLGYHSIIVKKWFQAINAFEMSIAIFPENPTSYFNLGHIYTELNLYEKSINAYVKALEYDNGDLLTIYYLGETYFLDDQYEQAIKCFKECISIDETFHDAYFSSANVFYVNKEYIKAELFIEKALSITKEDPEYFNLKADIKYALLKVDEAEENYLAAMELDPETSVYLESFLRFLIKEARYKDAVEVFENSHYVEPSDELTFLVFISYFYAGKRQESYIYFGDLLEKHYVTYVKLQEFPEILADDFIIQNLIVNQ